MKRWEDLDENLQSFLGITPYYCEHLMIRKIKKCVNDFKNCEFFEYYGYEVRNEADIDSDDEPDDFNFIENLKNQMNTAMQQKGDPKAKTFSDSIISQPDRKISYSYNLRSNLNKHNTQVVNDDCTKKSDFEEVDLSEEENANTKYL